MGSIGTTPYTGERITPAYALALITPALGCRIVPTCLAFTTDSPEELGARTAGSFYSRRVAGIQAVRTASRVCERLLTGALGLMSLLTMFVESQYCANVQCPNQEAVRNETERRRTLTETLHGPHATYVYTGQTASGVFPFALKSSARDSASLEASQ